jgi:hypothetical protein
MQRERPVFPTPAKTEIAPRPQLSAIGGGPQKNAEGLMAAAPPPDNRKRIPRHCIAQAVDHSLRPQFHIL